MKHATASDQQIDIQVITVSDTRTIETDKSGKHIIGLLENEGHSAIKHTIVKDEKDQVQQAIRTGLDDGAIEGIIINGGTGIAKRDITIEVVESFLEKELIGFGEIFRYLSYTEDIGPAAILSRATAGVVDRKFIFSLPGSTGAVDLAMKKLILPEMGHVYLELQRDR